MTDAIKLLTTILLGTGTLYSHAEVILFSWKYAVI